MLNCKEKIVHIAEPKTMDFFPERFSNEIYYSEVEEGTPLKYTSSFSIKYVLEGYEKYVVGNSRCRVGKGQYLIVNNGQEVDNLESNAKALSIFVDQSLIDNVLQDTISSHHNLLENPCHRANDSVSFFENVYPKNDLLGQYLDLFYNEFIYHQNFEIHEEVYYSIAANLISAQLDVLGKIERIDRVKFSTRCELYKRVLIAKEYIEANTQTEFNLDILSRACFLSKFHLIRIFKTVFGTTPYHYYLRLKVDQSKQFLQDLNLPIADAARLAGFADSIAYSKRFKASIGLSPAAYRLHYINGDIE